LGVSTDHQHIPKKRPIHPYLGYAVTPSTDYNLQNLCNNVIALHYQVADRTILQEVLAASVDWQLERLPEWESTGDFCEQIGRLQVENAWL